jgi:hypothetical protein
LVVVRRRHDGAAPASETGDEDDMKIGLLLAALAGTGLVAACAAPTGGAVTSSGAAASAGDAADHACQVALYDAKISTTGSTPPVFPIKSADGKMWWPFTATVSVAASLPAGSKVGLLYAPAGGAWRTAMEDQSTPAANGWSSHMIEFGEGLYPFTYSNDWRGEIFFESDGLRIPELDGQNLQIEPFVVLPDGTTLYDHNQNTGDFDNYWVSAINHWDVPGPAQACFHF